MTTPQDRERAAAIKTLEKLHEGKIGAHWIWCALQQIAEGQSEDEVMGDFQWVRSPSVQQSLMVARVPQSIVDHLRYVAAGPFEDRDGNDISGDARTALAALSEAPRGGEAMATYLEERLAHWTERALKAEAALATQAEKPVGAEALQFLSDVVTAAGLLSHGKQSKALAERISTRAMKFRFALAHPPEPVEPAPWQPIETAPRDGRTLLLGRFNSLGKWRTMRGRWMSETYIGETWEEPDDAEPGWYETVVESDDTPNCWWIEPTHWQALPPAPSIEQGEGL